MNASALVTVPFHVKNLFIINKDNEPYTPMKPIVEGMGLDWASQYTKLKNNAERWGIAIITIPSASQLQQTVCLPLRKLFGWLMTIHPSKVKAEIRDTVIQYQNECDEVLYRYWKNETALPFNPQKDIQDELYRVSGGKRSVIAELSRRLRDRFGVARYPDIPDHQCQAAVEYVRSLKGEYIPHERPVTAHHETMSLSDGRYFVVVENGRLVFCKDATGHSLINNAYEVALRCDMRQVSLAVDELRARMRILSGEYDGNYLLQHPLQITI